VKRILDLGCGWNKRNGAVGLDINMSVGADILHDLNDIPYPIKDSEFHEIYLDNVLEHLDNVIEVMQEIHRIGKPEALVKIIVPYFRSRFAFVDPTHKHYFSVESLSYFDHKHPFFDRYKYSHAKFEILSKVFNDNVETTRIGKVVKRFANRYPTIYERLISHYYSLDCITFCLMVIKPTDENFGT